MMMNTNPTIILDMDDVLCNLFGEWIARYNEDYNDTLTKENFPEWEMHHVVKCGINIYNYLCDEEIYKWAEIYPGAFETTQKWIDRGYNIIVATRVHEPIAAKAKIEWMQEHIPHLVDRMHIVTGNTKHYLQGTIMIDDGLHNLEYFNGIKIVFDQPWNRSNNKYWRVKDWNQLDNTIDLWFNSFTKDIIL